MEPRDAIHRVQQGAGEREQVEKFLALGEVLDFDGAKWNFAAAKKRDDLGKMGAGANENRDTIFSAGGAGLFDVREVLLEYAEDVECFLLLRLTEVGRGRPMVR
jgi:hypothetical protein